jgi:folate-binding protein YgfZ
MLAERWQTLTAELETDESIGQDEVRPTAALIEGLRPLCFEGADVLNFLQGYLTINLEQLVDGQPRFTALTNLKGRVVATGWCQLRGSERVDWLIHRELTSPVSEFLSRYLAFSRTALIEPEAGCIAVGIVDRDGVPRARLICDDAEFNALVADHRPVDAAAWYTACIKHGSVLIGPESTEAYLPQMIGLVEANAVDFDKGCYLGQEVVARAQHRGEVKRRLVQLTGVDVDMQAGSQLLDSNGKQTGSVLMSLRPLCLAVVRQPAAARYRAGEAQLEVVR